MYQRPSISSDVTPDRAVTEVLGAILVFGLVLAVLALVQVSAIPVANGQVEFEHSQRVAGDFQALDQNVDAAGTRGSLGSTSVEAGVRYPNRLFFINPGPVGGSLTSTSGSVLLTDFTGTSADEADDYDLGTSSFPTTGLRYSATYNEYADAPTIHYENGVLFERYENVDGTVQDIVVDGGGLVSGRRITIITVEGDFSTQVPDRLPINVVSVSAGTRAVTVDGGPDSRIAVETILSRNTWADILSSELASGQVEAVTCPGQPDPALPCDGTLTIDLADDVYDLRMAKVGLTTNDNQNPAADFSEEAARYIVAETTTSTSAVTGQSVELVAEVRDRFNNPVSGQMVDFTITSTSGGSIATDSTPRSGVDGLGSVSVDTTGATGPIVVEATMNDTPGEEQRVTYTITLVSGDGSNFDGNNTETEDTLSTINDRIEGIYVADTAFKNVVNSNNVDQRNPDTFRVTFRNSDEGQAHYIRDARISFVLSEEVAVYANVTDAETDEFLGRLYVGDAFVPVTPIQIDPGAQRVLNFTFIEIPEPTTNPERNEREADLTTSNAKADAFMALSLQTVPNVVGQATAEDEVLRQTFFVTATPASTRGAFLGANVTDLAGNSDQSSNGVQTITFTLNRGLNAGENVTVDLTEAVGAGIDYSGATVTVVDAGGTASYDGADTLTYSAAENGVAGGTTVTLELSGIDEPQPVTDSITITFTRTDIAGSETATFDVN